MSTFKTIVNSNYTFNIEATEALNLDTKKLAKNTYHIIENAQGLHAEILAADFDKKTYTIRINTSEYTVSLHDDLDGLIHAMGFEIGAHQKVNEIVAPMPGLVIDVLVDEGQTVAENDPIIILEAMKMENSLTAPRDGIIKSIAIKNGDTVDKNNILITFE